MGFYPGGLKTGGGGFKVGFYGICCIFLHEVSTSGYCSRELKRNSKVVYQLTKVKYIYIYIYIDR